MKKYNHPPSIRNYLEKTKMMKTLANKDDNDYLRGYRCGAVDINEWHEEHGMMGVKLVLEFIRFEITYQMANLRENLGGFGRGYIDAYLDSIGG